VAVYPTDQLRMTLVYRARCFGSAQEAARFRAMKPSDKLPLDVVLDILKADLVRRGRLSTGENPAPLDLALLLLDEYIHYPHSPDAIFPLNYCALPKLLPWTSVFLAPFC